MSGRADLFLWVALPYICIAIFVAGHIWRYRRDQLGWTARSTQLLEDRLLKWGSWLFHLGMLGLIAGHIVGILVPKSVTDWIGIGSDAYHWIAIVGGLVTGWAAIIGLGILLYRRLANPRVRETTIRSDYLLYPLLLVVMLSGMAGTMGENLILGKYEYRDVIAPWFRDIWRFSPDALLMSSAPIVFKLHATSAWLLFAAWPFTRLVHVWSVPFAYLFRKPIPYRSRAPRSALAGSNRGRAPIPSTAGGGPVGRAK